MVLHRPIECTVSCGAKRSIPTVALGTGDEGHARSPNAPCSSAPGACPDRVGASLRHPFFGLEEENHPQTCGRSSLFRSKNCKLKTDNCFYELVGTQDPPLRASPLDHRRQSPRPALPLGP